MWALSNDEIDGYYRGNKLYLGTYAKDVIPQKLAKRVGAMVVNMNNSDEGGSHWTLIIQNKDNTVCFDSFGVVPSMEVMEYMKKRKLPMYYVDRQLQDLDASSCGWYCLHFINECTLNGRHILDVLAQDFTYDVIRNEKLLQGYLMD